MDSCSKSFSHIAPVFRVHDLTRSIAFYRDRLGFDLEFCYEDFYASVVRDGCHIHLQCAPPAQRDQAAFELKEHLDACVVVGSAKDLAKSLAAAGAPFTVPLRQMPYGTEFYVRDPDGYILGFVQPASEWPGSHCHEDDRGNGGSGACRTGGSRFCVAAQPGARAGEGRTCERQRGAAESKDRAAGAEGGGGRAAQGGGRAENGPPPGADQTELGQRV